jgi:hypothetical protein
VVSLDVISYLKLYESRLSSQPWVVSVKVTASEITIAQSFVAIQLVTVRIGFTPARNSAAMIPSPSVLLSTAIAVPPSQLKAFEDAFWKGVSLMSAAGTYSVVPEGFSED